MRLLFLFYGQFNLHKSNLNTIKSIFLRMQLLKYFIFFIIIVGMLEIMADKAQEPRNLQ